MRADVTLPKSWVKAVKKNNAGVYLLDSRSIIKLWDWVPLDPPTCFPIEAHYPAALALNTAPTPKKMTQPALLNFVRQRFCNRCHLFFLLLPERLETVLRSPTSFGCLKSNTGNVTARRNSKCHGWHIPHPFGMSSSFFWTPDWFWHSILGISYEKEFCD